MGLGDKQLSDNGFDSSQMYNTQQLGFGKSRKQTLSVPYALNQARQLKGTSSLAVSQREHTDTMMYDTQPNEGFDETIGLPGHHGVNSMPQEIRDF